MDDGGTGVVVDDLADLPAGLAELDAGWAEFSDRAARRYQQAFTPHAWSGRILTVYRAALTGRGAERARGRSTAGPTARGPRPPPPPGAP